MLQETLNYRIISRKGPLFFKAFSRVQAGPDKMLSVCNVQLTHDNRIFSPNCQ